MTTVVVDFETASACDLGKAGAWVYSEHPTTEILCLVWHADGVLGDWSPLIPGSDYSRLRSLAADPGNEFVSHGAFEQAIWHNIMVPAAGMPELPAARWVDTMATAAWRSLPLSLKALCIALDLPARKDTAGSRLTVGLSRPHQATGMLDRSPATIARVIQYCRDDVLATVALYARLGRLSRHERDVWLLDQTINRRGIRLDMAFVAAAERIVHAASAPLLAEFRALTGRLNPGQVAAVLAWCAAQGTKLSNLQKETIDRVLAETEDLPSAVRRALEIRRTLGGAAVKKLAAMRACVGNDGRARGLLQYHAAGTGRWGGRLMQPQNFPRGSLAIPTERVAAAVASGSLARVEQECGPAVEAVASALKYSVVADPGKIFLIGDFSSIEARIVLALAGQRDKTKLMAEGRDIYLDFAETMYHLPAGSLTKKDEAYRHKGKGGVLGAGFQCGPEKFNAQFLGGRDIETAELIVNTYRHEWAPKVPLLWRAMHRAVTDCVATGDAGTAYGCQFVRDGNFMAIDLPSGWQRLWYHSPGMRRRDGELCPSYVAPRQTVWLYGGLVTENVVQALARGLLVEAMFRLEKAGFPVVLTVHDEIVCEVPEASADLARFGEILAAPTVWSARLGIPLAVETRAGRHYSK